MIGLLAKLNVVTILLLLVAVAGGGAAYYFYSENQKIVENPNLIAQEEAKKLVEAVGKLIDLPTGEDPTIATVTDASKVKDQPFFARAENGDKVLIFTKAKKAILYRPSTNKVIEVAPLNIGESQTQVQTIRVALYNGTNTTGLTNKAEPRVEENVANTEVVLKENASKDDYEGTVVVDLSGTRKDVASAIAEELGGTVEALPSGEERPENADILVILGADFR